ncbi:DNA cytosine methyltransferase [Cryobacterium sp. BB736]|uniref:DNA cytosine methyltransferase n=1 Tax=Cryobacterium sp. BB736 TaxID=2746963 RepID=UPI0018747D7C|nr:DNA cytosine methyltransferase [Cryobacterium sp. BB736]
MFRYVDLFSGCGGLSLGLERAGGTGVFAVEKSEMAAQTYFANFISPGHSEIEWNSHLALPLEEQALRGLAVGELRQVLENEDLVLHDDLADVVVGGPPCQGFSLAGRRDPDDTRNTLPWEFLDFVGRTSPRAVVIENVVGMSHRFEKDEHSPFRQLQLALEATGEGYEVQGVAVNAKHYGAPQHRPRLMIIGLRSDVAKSHGIRSTGTLWRSKYVDELDSDPPALAPRPTLTRGEERTVEHAIADLLLGTTRTAIRSAYAQELGSAADWNLPARVTEGLNNHVRRRHSDRVIERFKLYQWLASEGLSHRIIRDLNFGDVQRRSKAAAELRSVEFPARAPDETVLAQTFTEMLRLIESLATRKHSQKALRWDEPARTVVTLPDDYVHPSEPRIFTVRELARFQGFPDDFVFKARETTGAHRRRVDVPQYSQVGNAVSPLLGLAVGEMLDSLLSASPSLEQLEQAIA